MYKIDKNRSEPVTIYETFPVVATAANSGFYGVSQGLIKSVYEKLLPRYKDVKIVYYDMGLNRDQRTQVGIYDSIFRSESF